MSILYGNPDATTIDRFVEILVEHKHSVELWVQHKSKQFHTEQNHSQIHANATQYALSQSSDIVDVHGHVWTNMLALHRYLTTNENKQYLIQLARSKDALQEIEHLEKKLAEVKVDKYVQRAVVASQINNPSAITTVSVVVHSILIVFTYFPVYKQIWKTCLKRWNHSVLAIQIITDYFSR